VQPADLKEVVEKGVQALVIGRGMSEALKVGTVCTASLRTGSDRYVLCWSLSLCILCFHFAETVDDPG
jgi:hypothetical protein